MFALFCCLFAVFSTPVFADLTITQTSVGAATAPRGSTSGLLTFTVTATNGAETIQSITVQNNAKTVLYGQGVTRVSVFKDTDSDFFLTSADGSAKGFQSFSGGLASSQQVIINMNSEAIPSGSSATYIIAYDIDPAATLAATTNVSLISVLGSNATATFGTVSTGNTQTISGIASLAAVSIAPAVVLPGQTDVGMMKVTVRPSGENILNIYELKVLNDNANFAQNSSLNGVTKAYLYLDRFGEGTFDHNFLPDGSEDPNNDIKIQTISSFSSSSNITFSGLSENTVLNFADGVTQNLFVVYDFGSDFTVTTDTSVKAQMVSFSGKGDTSRVTMNSTVGSKPDPAASTYVGGLIYSDVRSIVPSGSLFGQESFIPILSFQLKGSHTAVTVNTISIQNTGTVGFNTTQGGVTNIVQAQLYLDSNGNDAFDGENSVDSKIGDFTLGSGNTSSLVTIPISSSLLIATYNSTSGVEYPNNNAKRIFVTYRIGTQVTETKSASGNITSYANALLYNAVGSSNIVSSLNLTLRGTLPVTTTNATVSLQIVNLRGLTFQDITPSFAVRGAIKVPMLYTQLKSEEDFPSVAVRIKNNSATYLTNNTGVNRVWIYKDAVPTGSFGSEDTFLGSASTYSNSSEVVIPGITLTTGLNDLLVLYDVGQLSTIATSSNATVRAQFEDVTGLSVATVTFGGEVPNPLEAKLGVINSYLSLPSISSDFDNNSDGKSTFNVTMVIQNNSASPVSLSDFSPRFYLSSTSGKDISYEFDTILSQVDGQPFVSLPVTVNASSSSTFNFQVKHARLDSEGTVFMDGFGTYAVSSTLNAVVSRYQTSSGWVLAAASAPQINVTTNKVKYSWTLPNYIASMKYGSSELGYKTFVNGDAIPANSRLTLIFQDSGQNIDESSLSFVVKGTTLSLNASDNASRYSYDRTTGTAVLYNLGTSDGTVVLNANDLSGNPLDTAYISYLVSDVVRIKDALFYPNPYRIGVEPLVLGFNITRPATVQVYLYNFLGYEVWRSSQDFSLGYNTFNFGTVSDFLTSGTFICKIIATDNQGNKSMAVAKLAIY